MPRILCVDDEPSVLRGLELVLRSRFTVITATSGAEGLRRLANDGPFEAVLSDFKMPEMDGAQFLAAVRRAAPEVPRLLLSGHVSVDSAIAVVNQGQVFKLLMKPCPSAELASALQEAVDFGRSRRQQSHALETKVEELSDHLQATERLATVGTIAAAVGHELANTATVFGTSLWMVEERAGEGRVPDPADLEALRNAWQGMTSQAKSLLQLGRRERGGSVEACDLARVLEETLGLLRQAGLLRRTAVRLDLPARGVLAGLSRPRAEQVLVNLLKNALDAIEEAERVEPELHVEVVEELAPGQRWVRCRITDNGCGIAAERLGQVFEAFHTTKPAGTGLGLYVVRQIVEEACGHVEVASAVGQGSTFTVRLPVEERPVVVDEAEARPPQGG